VIRQDDIVRIDLDRPMDEIRAELSKYPVTTRLSLTGTLIVARDIAHAKLKERLDRGEGLPEYFKNHPVYYAGPAKKPEGLPSGSFGPTTAGRMDPYVDLFQSHGGFYLGSPGGPAALLAKECIKKVEVLEYPELGMEAIWEIEVESFPAFILVDDKGNDFFQQL
jgi:fumarate hydratase class I